MRAQCFDIHVRKRSFHTHTGHLQLSFGDVQEPWEEKDTVSAVMPPVPEPAKMAGSNTLEAIETSAPAATMTMPPVEPEMVLAMPPAPKAKFSKPPKNLKVDTDQEKPTVATASFPEPTVVADVGMVEIKTPALKATFQLRHEHNCGVYTVLSL